MAMMPEETGRRAFRLLAIGAIIGLGAYWAGSRYGQHEPASVSAVPVAAPAPAAASEPALDPTETENVRIYKQASPSVANILTKTVEYDFFFNPVPVEGAGSGFLIDTDGHVLTKKSLGEGGEDV